MKLARLSLRNIIVAIIVVSGLAAPNSANAETCNVEALIQKYAYNTGGNAPVLTDDCRENVAIAFFDRHMAFNCWLYHDNGRPRPSVYSFKFPGSKDQDGNPYEGTLYGFMCGQTAKLFMIMYNDSRTLVPTVVSFAYPEFKHTFDGTGVDRKVTGRSEIGVVATRAIAVPKFNAETVTLSGYFTSIDAFDKPYRGVWKMNSHGQFYLKSYKQENEAYVGE